MGDEVFVEVRIVYTKRPRSGRLDRFLRGRRAVWQLVQAIDADVYHFHDPELLPVAIRLKKTRDKTIIFDFHENTEKT